jgi:hypothetical protein
MHYYFTSQGILVAPRPFSLMSASIPAKGHIMWGGSARSLIIYLSAKELPHKGRCNLFYRCRHLLFILTIDGNLS